MSGVGTGLTLSTAIVGTAVGPLAQPIDARWLMAYAAGLGEADPRAFDTEAPDGPVAHPLFPVCYEWPLALLLRAKAIDDAIAPLGVHATHRLTIHRSPRAGDVLATTARIEAVRSTRAGALVTIRFETADAAGRAVTTTLHGSLYRGVRVAETPPVDAAGGDGARDPGAVRWQTAVSVPPHAAHVYTECARIWNPIHTDLAVARAAGLPGLILHGTATLALALSRAVAHDLGAEPGRVREVRARFTGMVRMPSTFTVRGRDRDAAGIAFDAVDAAGQPVLSDGALGLRADG